MSRERRAMDDYTRGTKAWLEDRFRRRDARGIYVAHQPIYGFRREPALPGFVHEYIRTYRIMTVLGRLRFSSFLDVGGAEGFRAFLVREWFGVPVKSCDLSEEACRRARELFDVDSAPVDVHQLPFQDNAYDVVLCSETLEHVARPQCALGELVRVARRAVVITVPHEPAEVVEDNVARGRPHAHIHDFTLTSFQALESQGYRVHSRRMISPLLALPSVLVEAVPRPDARRSRRYPSIALRWHQAALPLLQRLFGPTAAAALVRLDELLCRWAAGYYAILTVILKDPHALRSEGARRISARRIVQARVPYHYLPARERQGAS